MIRRYFLAFSTFISCLVAENPPTYGLQGQAVIFNPGIQTPPEDILWKHNGNKVVEFNGMTQTAYGSYEGRITLDWHAADIEIGNLRYEDSGEYVVEVFHKTLKTYTYKLQVIGKVSKPTITCEVNDDGSPDGSGQTATLTCSAESRQSQLMKFDWSSHGKQLQPGLHHPNLTITLGDERDHEMYNCSVSNPLTMESAVFLAKDCYTETSSSTGLIVGLCILFLILLVVSGGAVLVLRRYGYCQTKNDTDVENLDSNSVQKGSENNCRLPLDRAPTMPSDQQLRQPLLRNNAVSETEDGSEENGNLDKITPSPFAVPPKPRRSMNLRNDKGHADGDDPPEATENKVSENDPSESKKENEASPVQQNNHGSAEKRDQDKITPSRPAVAPKPRRSINLTNDRRHADGDDPPEATENKVSENEPSESEKENEASPGQQNNHGSAEKRNQDKITPSRPAVAPKPRRSINLTNDRRHADGDDPPEATENKVSENEPSESEKENEASPGQQNNHGSAEKRNQDKITPSRPAVAPKPRRSINLTNDRRHADGDDPPEATENKVSENEPSESEKENEASPGQQNNHESDDVEKAIVKINTLNIDDADDHQKNASSDAIGPEQVKEAGNEVRGCQPSTLEFKPAEIMVHDQNSMQPEVETHSREKTLHETDKDVSEDSNEPGDVGDQEERSHRSTPQQPHRSVSKPDNSDNTTHLESSNVAENAPDQEEKDKTRQSNHSDSRTEETDKSLAAEGTSSATETKRRNNIRINDSFSDDKEEQKKAEAVE